ncbi:BamA/OMP85 family outer membrane protein [Marinigracilibium pacificum]|uniref:Outer membrane protein assembly factor BamA n=1 Tax=Marinigracilibium pacificum TaxID=2729599 RepID=A0A848J9S6_9BACT|nr:POTRA domain-containing protein [Marinigracilibium pacificum]NMM49792.1 outer membrane protein assembly factor BamA [Marinigracilibium pacificum]
MRKLLIIVFLTGIVLSTYGQIGLDRFQKKQSKKIELNYSDPKEYEIAEITVSGVEYLDNNALISLSGLKVGDKIKIPGEAISNAVKNLWKQRILGDVKVNITKVQGDKVYLELALKEQPRLSTYQITGVNKTTQENLQDEIGLIRGSVVTDVLKKNTELSIRKYFVEKGFPKADIDIKQIADTALSNYAKLNIDIDKGVKVRVHEISFEGNDNYNAVKLRSKMKKTNEYARVSIFKDLFSRLFTFKPKTIGDAFTPEGSLTKDKFTEYMNEHVKLNFFNSTKFIPKEYRNDKNLLLDFYNSKGYRDAEIISDTVYYKDDRNINVHIKVDEGKRYYFRDIIWTGNYLYTDETLSAVLGIEKGDVYDKEKLSKRLNFDPTGSRDINSLYTDNGYLFFNIQPVEVLVEGDSIDIEMRIMEGGIATIDQVLVKGNNQTHDHVVLRELSTRPGDKFSRSNLIKTNQRLAQLGFFDPEQIEPQYFPDPENSTVDIHWVLAEQSNDQIELSGGWGGIYGFVGTLGLSLNNFSAKNLFDLSKWKPVPRGDGQRLSIRVQASGRQYQSYSFSFQEPWLGGRNPNAFSVNLSHTVVRSGASFFDPTSFTGSLKLTSLSVGLGRRVRWPDDFFQVSNSLAFSVYNLDNYPYLGLSVDDGKFKSLTLNTTISRSSIDNPIYTRSGSSISLSVALTPPFSSFDFSEDAEVEETDEVNEWIEYHKWDLDISYFTPIVGDLVFHAKANFGFLGTYNIDKGISPFERYVMGGSGLAGTNFQIGQEIIALRGYEDNAVTPPAYSGSASPAGDEIYGGVVFSKYTMELRYPISTNPGATIYVLGFSEAGNNWNNYQDFNPFNLYRSAGVGARIFMPAFGLIGIDWAYGFDRLPGQLGTSGPQFHFTIGNQLR